MALILNLETSTKNCSVSISQHGKLLVLCEEATDGYEHAEKLHQFIAWAFEGCDFELSDIDAVAVGKGPGSYTGLRIGVAAAKGICFALDKPLLSMNSLEIMAHSHKNQDYDFIIPMTDARRKEVYTTIFDKNLNEVSKTEAKILDETSFQEFKDKKVVFIGDGAEKAESILRLDSAEFQSTILPSAEWMCSAMEEKFQQSQFEDVAYFDPFYLKEFMAGK